MFLGCAGCQNGLGVYTVPGVAPQVQQAVIIGAAALVILGIGFYVWSRR